MTSKEWDKWLDEHNIVHIMTRGHANTAERAIRTFKGVMTRRLEGPDNKGVKWSDQVRLSVLMKYNRKMVNRTIGMTPDEATLRRTRHRLEQCLK